MIGNHVYVIRVPRVQIPNSPPKTSAGFVSYSIKSGALFLLKKGENRVRLFHVSEEPDIQVFYPRLPKRKDLDQSIGLVWALDEARLPNFLTPRDCPRVAYYAGSQTTDADRKRFFSSSGAAHAVVIENKWIPAMLNTTLHLYEFHTEDFVLQDSAAGYYVATTTQIPKKKHVLNNAFGALLKRNVEIRIIDNLWDIADDVKASTLNWSLCRMANAAPRA